uniref:zinc finger protein 239-like n=1 Tax=Oncorhynchus gorbuscha TaxID=8017 RepID=UPI001EAEB77C|nr:zinc finger protein 239-like [Oncorhynchus gorbuscha]
MDELPVGTKIEHWLNSVKPESYDPEMGNTRGPTESDPRTEAHHLGIKAEDAPLYFQDGRIRLWSATSQQFNLTAFRSDPEWRPRNQKVRRFLWTEVLLQNHAGVPVSTHSTGRTPASDAQPYVCPQYSQGFKISAHLKRHMTAHSGCKLYVCPECGQSYMSLKYHRLSHTGECPLSCPECPMTFAGPHTLMIHRRQHTGETPFSCQDCGNQFKQRCKLKDHVRRKHTGEKPYKCSDCDKCFVTSASHNAHMVVHTREKPYKCIECGISYSQSGNLTQHMRRHAGEKPYKCSECDKCFVNSTLRKVHMVVHTGEKPYKCTQCGKSYSQTGSLKRHRCKKKPR